MVLTLRGLLAAATLAAVPAAEAQVAAPARARAVAPVATPRVTPAPAARAVAPAAPAAAAPAVAQPEWEWQEPQDAEAQQQGPEAWIGIGLSCSRCSFHTEGKSLSRWVFAEPPVLYSVEPRGPADRAGLRIGDTLMSVNGQPLTSARGGQSFANLRPGVQVRLTYRRDGRERTTSVRPEARPPDVGADVAAQRALDERARTFARTSELDAARVRRQLDRARAELDSNRGKLLSPAAVERLHLYLDQAGRALEVEGHTWLLGPNLPAPTPTPSPTPSPTPTPPEPPSLGVAVAPPAGLRYSGRLGNVVIEARRPGGVSVIETADSAIALTGGDLMVRIAIEGAARPPAVAGPWGASWGTARTRSGDVANGIQGYVLNARLGAALGAASGVLVLDVSEDSHADSLGILPGDVLVSLNEHPVVSFTPGTPFSGRLLRTPTLRPGAASAVVVRGRARRTLELGSTAPARPRATTPRRD